MSPRSWHDRLERFLLRERAAGLDGVIAGYAEPLVVRVESGTAVAGLRVAAREPQRQRLVLKAPRNHSSFRPGDALRLGDGTAPLEGVAVDLVDYDAIDDAFTVEPGFGSDYATLLRRLPPDGTIVLDRSPVDTSEMLRRALAEAFDRTRPESSAVRALIEHELATTRDAEAAASAEVSLGKLVARGYNLSPSQQRAFVEAWARGPAHLVQGPPGTGKTFLLGLLLAALAWRGERILVTAHTHLAVDNVLRAVGRIVVRERRPLPLLRIGARAASHRELDGLPVEFARGARAFRPPTRGGCVVGTTLLKGLSFPRDAPFHRVVFDEAAQVPLPHALCALLAGQRWLFVGDDRQLGPVVQGEHADAGASASIFAHLRAVLDPTLLEETFRLNDELCQFPSRAFYGGRLKPAAEAAGRRFEPAVALPPRLAPILAPSPSAVLVVVPHEGCQQSCPAEADLIAELAAELLGPQRVAPEDLALISPFRQQNRELAQRLRRRLPDLATLPTIDTVERIQGQDREVVLVSLVASDPTLLARDTGFFFAAERLCVTLTRARRKLVVVASPALLEALPGDLDGLRRVELFHRLFAELPRLAWPPDGAGK